MIDAKVKKIILDVYNSETDDPLGDVADALIKALETEKLRVYFDQVHISAIQNDPQDVANMINDCARHKPIDWTMCIVPEYDIMNLVALIEK